MPRHVGGLVLNEVLLHQPLLSVRVEARSSRLCFHSRNPFLSEKSAAATAAPNPKAAPSGASIFPYRVMMLSVPKCAIELLPLQYFLRQISTFRVSTPVAITPPARPKHVCRRLRAEISDRFVKTKA